MCEPVVGVSDNLRADVEQALTTAAHLSREEHQRMASIATTLPIPDLIRVSAHTIHTHTHTLYWTLSLHLVM